MSYMLLIVEPREQRVSRAPEDGHAVYDRMVRFTHDLKSRGILRASESLVSDDRAVRVQVRDGQSRLVDGPFVEAKEMVGGFFLLDCDSHDEALKIARECPAAEWCTVEVRETGPCYE
jgi:hypothetical protein